MLNKELGKYTLSFSGLWEDYKDKIQVVKEDCNREKMTLTGITLRHSWQVMDTEVTQYFDAYLANTNIMVGCDGETFSARGTDEENIVELENEGMTFYMDKKDFESCAWRCVNE